MFYVPCNLLHASPSLFDSVVTRLFQLGLVPSDFALNKISRRWAEGQEYEKRILELQKEALHPEPRPSASLR